MGDVIGGGLTLLIAAWLAGYGGLAMVDAYLAEAGVLSMAALVAAS